MIISELLKITERKLRDAKIKSARLDAELIIANILQKSREWVLAHDDFKLDNEALVKIQVDINRRKNREPLAYILGRKEFYGRNFIVNKNVLIPRPETEQVIDIVKEIVKKGHKINKIVDIGTGSGVIAIILALEFPDVKIIATEKYHEARVVAQTNREKFQLQTNRVNILAANLLKVYISATHQKDWLGINRHRGYYHRLLQCDMIVANLPYVDKKWNWLDKKTLRFEPRTALFARGRGLKLIKKLIRQAPDYLRNEGFLILELDTIQMGEIKRFAAKYNFTTYDEKPFTLTLQKLAKTYEI